MDAPQSSETLVTLCLALCGAPPTMENWSAMVGSQLEKAVSDLEGFEKHGYGWVSNSGDVISSGYPRRLTTAPSTRMSCQKPQLERLAIATTLSRHLMGQNLPELAKALVNKVIKSHFDIVGMAEIP